jgi:hypothetical protein
MLPKSAPGQFVLASCLIGTAWGIYRAYEEVPRPPAAICSRSGCTVPGPDYCVYTACFECDNPPAHQVLWASIIDWYLDDKNPKEAVNFIRKIHTSTERQQAIEYTVIKIASLFSQPTPAPLAAPTGPTFQGSSAETRTAKKSTSHRVRVGNVESDYYDEPQDSTEARTDPSTKKPTDALHACLQVGQELQMAEEQASTLLRIAVAYKTVGDLKTAGSVFERAVKAFERNQEDRYGTWATCKRYLTDALKGLTHLGIVSILLINVMKAFWFYLRQPIAALVGNEQFAQAIGTTIKKARKQYDKLILPDDLRRDV